MLPSTMSGQARSRSDGRQAGFVNQGVVSLAFGQDAQHEARVLGAVLVDEPSDGGGRLRLPWQWIDVGGNDFDVERCRGILRAAGGRASKFASSA